MSQVHKTLIEKITDLLQADERVLAAWLEGSLARREEDDFSDIDLWITVKDQDFAAFVAEREEFAAKLGPVVSVLYPKTADQGDDLDSFQVMLEDQPATLTIDVDVQKRSRRFRFTKDSAAEECEVLFDRGNIVQHQPFNPAEVEEYVADLFADTAVRFWHLLPKVQVQLKRSDILEAIDLYNQRLLELVTVYRILYTPEKSDWGWKDLEYDLPEDAVKSLYNLMPEVGVRAMERQVGRLAKTFSKQSKLVAKRLRVELPKELIRYVSSQL
jgi:predicted nucleotidyltransferase